MKLTKELFDKLYSENITKKEYDKILDKIDERFAEIMTFVCPKLEKNGWFDYNNEGGENCPGYFDPDLYKDEIKVTGEGFDILRLYNYRIPTRWLYEDFEQEFTKDVRKDQEASLKEKEDRKNKREILKKNKVKFKTIITSKLTKEELKYISFK